MNSKIATKIQQNLQDYRTAYFSSNFANEDKVLIHHEILLIRTQIGFSLPEFILNIIKQYLLLPRDIYQARLTWWNRQISIPIVYTLEDILRITSVRVPPNTSTIQAVRILYNEIIKKKSKIVTFEVEPPEEDADIRCWIKHCNTTNDLVVKPMCYLGTYGRVTTKNVMDRYICNDCIKENYHKMECRGCSDLHTWDKLTYHVGKGFGNAGSWANHKNFWCRRCVIDINKRMQC